MANDKLPQVAGATPKTPTPGYRFGEHRCSTPSCRANRHLFRYEIRVGDGPFRLKANHVRCDACSQLYLLTVTEDGQGAQVSARPFVD